MTPPRLHKHRCCGVPVVLPARSPPQLAFGFDQTVATDDWPEMVQNAGHGADGWE